jgi:tripartite-type tricarboxylate transporter receptor subunit TctC
MVKTIVAAAIALLLGAPGMADAQDWPTRAVNLVVPYAAGGPVDTIARSLAAQLSESLGQQVVVENAGGAGGMTGAARVAKSAPDGYTVLLSGSAVLAINQTLYKRPLYNAVSDFEHVALFADSARVLIVRKDLPASTLPEFVAYAKANQAKMQYGSAGAGSATHLGCVLLNYVLGTDITHVPYRGTGPAMQDLHAGRIDFLCEIITTAKPQVDGGAVKALAIFDKARSSALPNLPTAAEQGTPNLEAYTWNALFLPKDTPEPIVKKLNAAAVEAMKSPAVKDRLTGLGAQVVSDDRMTPAYLGTFLKAEIEKWAAPIKAAGVQVD